MGNFKQSSYKYVLIVKKVSIALLLLTLTFTSSYAQLTTKLYANFVSKESHVDNSGDALKVTDDVRETKYASVKSYGGVLFGGGAYTGELELKMPLSTGQTDLPAGTTTYVRIDFDASVLNTLLGGNIGGLLSNVLENVVGGQHSFEIGARDSNNKTVLSGSSTAAFASNNLRLVKDENGYFYVAVTPNVPYSKIYIKDITTAVALGGTNSTKVYYAYYNSGSSPCDQAFATGYDETGLTLDLLGLGKAGVTNMQYAIDADQTNYSELSLGALAVSGSISQLFYFNTLSNSNDDINLRLKISSALLSAGVLSKINITAYNGNDEVFSQSASKLLSVDLLGLLNAGKVVSIPFSPGVSFNRVAVTLSSLLNANLTQTIFIYGVTRSAGRPTFVPTELNDISICYNTSASLTATTDNINELRWYTDIDGGTFLANTAYNQSYVTPLLTANQIYYVAARKVGCTQESARVPVKVTVRPEIVFNTTTLNNATVGFGYNKQIKAATGGTSGFTYSFAGGTPPPGITISSSGLISGNPTTSGNFTFSIKATDGKSCTSTANFSLKVNATLTLLSIPLKNGVTGTIYDPQTIPLATGGTEPYQYAADNLPPGLSFDPVSRQITGTPTQKGQYTVPVKVTDNDGNSIITNFTIKITDPLVLPTAVLASGITGIVYNTQIIPSATGGTTPYTYQDTGLPPGLTFNSTTREIKGIPTVAGTFTVQIKVNDSDGNSVTTNYTIKVTDPLVMPAAALPDGTVATLYNAQTLPSATGGVGPYTYVGTGLPPGLTFNAATRIISGTPTQAGTYSVKVVVTDAENRTANNTYSIKIIGVLTLPPATLPSGIVGTTYPAQTIPNVSGGTGPYIYAAVNLPPGLNFNTDTHEITGTPTVGGTYTVSVTVTDANQNKVSTDYLIVVNVNAPIVANVFTCSGSTAALSVSNLQNGVTYNWYGATGSTALATNNTGVFVTPIVTSNTSFYVEAVSGTAVSSRVAVMVNVYPAANPATVTSNDQTISAGQTATLTATADANNIIKWFADAVGGTELTRGNSFTTPILNTTTTYYIETVNENGCKSAARVPVTVTVINVPSNVNCNVANKQRSGIVGICILCGIIGPGNSTDADLTNSTTIRLGAGVGALGYQQLIFPAVGKATDSLRLTLGIPTGLLDLSVLSDVTLNVMNGSSTVKSYKLNPALLNLVVLGGNKFRVTVPATQIYDRVELRFGGLATVLTSLDIYSAEVLYPKPTLVASSVTICSGSTATLTATANGPTTLKWYDRSSGGTLLKTGESYTTETLTATKTYYIEVSQDGCANTERIPVTVNVTPFVEVPVVTASSNVCAGSSASLSVSNPNPAVTYNWYTDINGTTPVYTGSVYNTPAITANTTYYVEAKQGNCISSSRATTTVNVNPRPSLPVLSASSSTVGYGQTAVLTAGPAQNDVVFKWYTSANATLPVFAGDVYVTPPLTSSATYYVEAQTVSTGCTSASRVQITILVNPSVPNPVPCEAPISQTNGASGVGLFSAVFNPALAIDNDTQTGSSLVLPVGVINASVYQNVVFSSLSKVGDTVRMLINSPGKLLSSTVLGNLQVTTFINGSSNNDPVILNNNMINVQLLSGSTQALITFVPTKVFDGVELRLNSGALNALSSINLNYVQRILAVPEVQASNVTVCANQKATLEVKNPSANVIYKWYDANGDYIAGSDGSTYMTGTITANTKFLVAAVSATGCVSNMTPVNVTLIPPPVAELVSSDINACINSDVVLQIKNPVSGITYRWYDAAGNYQNLKDAPTFTVNNVTANTSYSVEAVVNACGTVSAKATANINVGVLDIPVITPTNVTVSYNTPALLKATSSTAGAVINWYDSPSNGTLLHTGEVFVTPNIIANTTFYAEASVVNGCPPSARASVLVKVFPNVPPVTGSCGLATISANKGVDGTAPLAGVFNDQLAVDNLTTTGSTLFIPAGIVGASVYHQVNFTSLSNVGDTLRLKISSPAKLLSLAELPSIMVTTFKANGSNGDGISINNPLIHLELLSDGSSAILTYIPTKQFDGVELRLNSGLLSVLSSVNFDYAQRSIPDPVLTDASLSICEGTTADLRVKNPQPNVTYKWYLDGDYQTGKDGTSFTAASNLSAGDHTFIVTATANGCETAGAKAIVSVLATPPSPVPYSNNPTTACLNTAVTLSVQQSVLPSVTYNWYDKETGGNMLVTNNNSYTTPANLVPGTYDFFVEAVNGSGCKNTARTKITLLINPSSTADDIQVLGDLTVCSGAGAILTASSSTVLFPVFNWYSDPSLQNNVNIGAQFTVTSVPADTKYYVTVSGSNKCGNSAVNAKEVTIKVNPAATAADMVLSGSTNICLGSPLSITASSTTVNNPIFTWYKDAGLTDQVFEGNNFINTNLSADITYYVTVRGDNKCKNKVGTAKSITIKVNSLAIASDITVTGSLTICKNSTTTLRASSANVDNPIFTWYTDTAPRVKIQEGAELITSPLLATTNYYVTVKGDNKCENLDANAKLVTVNVNEFATASDITAADAKVCSGSNVILTASSATVNQPIFTWYSNSSLNTVVNVGPSYALTSVTASADYYVTVKGANKCENAVSDAKKVSVVVNNLATATDIDVTGNTTVCAGATISLTASSTIANPVFTWYTDADLTNIASLQPNLSAVATNNVTYYVTVRGLNICENVKGTAKEVNIIVNPIPAVPVVATTGTNICAGSTTTLSVQNAQSGVTYDWYSAAAGGSIVYTGSTVTTVILNASVDYYVQATGSCVNSTRTKVTVTVNPIPAVPVVATTGTNICAGTATILSVQNPQAGVTYDWYNAAIGGSIVYSGATVTTVILNTSVDYYVQATGNCANSNRFKVTVTVNTRPIVPTVTANAVSVCTGSTGLLSISSPQTGTVYNWYATAANGTIIGMGTSFTTPPITGNISFYVEAAVGNCTSSTRAMVNVTALAVPVAPVSVAVSPNLLCTGSSTTLTVNNPDASLIYRWYAASSGGVLLNEGASFTTPNLSATTIYYVESVTKNGGCASPTRTAVLVNILPVLAAPVVSVQSADIRGITFTWNSVPGATAYEVSLDNGLTWQSPIGGALGTSYLVAGLKPDQQVSIIVRAKGQIDCQTSANSTMKIISKNPLGNEVYIPNTFTPNNDGKNDVFLVYGNTIADVKMSVYTQWGQLLFQSQSINHGWDGTYKGVAQPVGVYVYLIEIESKDGIKSIRKGTITLVR